jgi:hypothetical protein
VPGGTTSLGASAYDAGYTYQWQVNTGSGYLDLADSMRYQSAQQRTLNLVSIPSSFSGHKYRCVISQPNGRFIAEKFILIFAASWTGSIDTDWNNAGNWSCNLVPGGNTDVIINNGYTVIFKCKWYLQEYKGK